MFLMINGRRLCLSPVLLGMPVHVLETEHAALEVLVPSSCPIHFNLLYRCLLVEWRNDKSKLDGGT